MDGFERDLVQTGRSYNFKKETTEFKKNPVGEGLLSESKQPEQSRVELREGAWNCLPDLWY